jgi:hypothetical protein
MPDPTHTREALAQALETELRAIVDAASDQVRAGRVSRAIATLNLLSDRAGGWRTRLHEEEKLTRREEE